MKIFSKNKDFKYNSYPRARFDLPSRRNTVRHKRVAWVVVGNLREGSCEGMESLPLGVDSLEYQNAAIGSTEAHPEHSLSVYR